MNAVLDVTSYWWRRAIIARDSGRTTMTVTPWERNEIRGLPAHAVGVFPYSWNPEGRETLFGIELRVRRPAPWPEAEDA